MLASLEKPDFLFDEVPVSWKRASHRVLVVGEEPLVHRALPRFLQTLERYARENDVLLFVPGEESPFRGNRSKVQILERFVGEYWGRLEISEEESWSTVRDLSGSVVLLVGPAAFSEAGKVFGINALHVSASLWRSARKFSFAAFAVHPDSEEYFSAFPESSGALTLARLCPSETGAGVEIRSARYPIWEWLV